MRLRQRPRLILAGLMCFTLLLMLGAANMGALTLYFRQLWHAPISDPLWHIWLNIRLPRVLLALLVGSALAAAGAVMRGLFRNPLADPGLLGISSGAALFVAFAVVDAFGPSAVAGAL